MPSGVERMERSPILRFAVLAVLSLVAWGPTLRGGFVADDAFLVFQDPAIETWTFEQLRCDFASCSVPDPNPAYYRPLQRLLIRTQFWLTGPRPFLYHLVNFLAHTSNALLLAHWAPALGVSPLAAFAAAALFAVHPGIVHELIQGTGAEPIAFLLMMLTLFFLTRPRQGWPIGLAIYSLALFFKESALLVPVIVAFWPTLPFRDRLRRALLATLWWLPYFWLRHLHVSEGLDLAWPLVPRFLIQAFPKIVGWYLWTEIIPVNLQSWPPIFPLSRVWWASLLVAGVTVGLFVRRYGKPAVFCIAWIFLMMLARVPAMMSNGVLMNHWFYAASPALLIPLGIMIWKGWEQRRTRVVSGVAFVAFLIGWSAFAQFYSRVRQTDEANYRWTLRFGSPDFALYRLGIIELRSGRAHDAIATLEQLQAQTPGDNNFENALGLAYAHAGQRDRAKQLFEQILRRDPDFGPARNNLRLLAQRGSRW